MKPREIRETGEQDLFRSRLDQIIGVGEIRRTKLLREFGSLEKIAAATDEELREAAGVDAKTAAEIRKALGASERNEPSTR